MVKEGSEYQSYLLRLYPAHTPSRTVCRATLQSTRGGERVGFASLRDAFDYLAREMGLVRPKPFLRRAWNRFRGTCLAWPIGNSMEVHK